MNITTRPPAIILNEENVSLGEILSIRKQEIDQLLDENGAVLFRGFSPVSVEDFQKSVECYSTEVMEHSERLTKRTHVGGKINTTTEYNSKLKILLHTENSFSHRWPQKMFFYCIQPSETGGETPLADVVALYERLSEKTKEKFQRLGVKYVRNFWEGFGPDWKTVYGVDSKEELIEKCIQSGIQIEWPESNRPRIIQNWPAVLDHPKTGKTVWFNHVTTSNLSSVAPQYKELIISGFSQIDYPNNTYYGDGSVIEPEVLDEINEAYDALEYKAPWLEGDVLLVDNMRMAHGRQPFTGERKVVVAMIDPMSR